MKDQFKWHFDFRSNKPMHGRPLSKRRRKAVSAYGNFDFCSPHCRVVFLAERDLGRGRAGQRVVFWRREIWEEEELDNLHWEGHRQSDKHWNSFKGSGRETSQRRDGAHMGFSARIDTILSWAELNWTSLCLLCSFAGEVSIIPKLFLDLSFSVALPSSSLAI